MFHSLKGCRLVAALSRSGERMIDHTLPFFKSRRTSHATISMSAFAPIMKPRIFNQIMQCRHVATRYDKLAANYLAFVKLASIRIWLRANESAP